MMSFGVSGSSVTSVTVRHHYSLVPSQLSLFFFFLFFFFQNSSLHGGYIHVKCNEVVTTKPGKLKTHDDCVAHIHSLTKRKRNICIPTEIM